MLDQFKMMGQLAGLLKDKERLQRVSDEFRRTLELSKVTGEAGGGAVRVTMTGNGVVIGVELDPHMVSGMGADDQSRTMAESLISEATNDALRQVQALLKKEASAAAEELGLSEIPGAERLLGAF